MLMVPLPDVLQVLQVSRVSQCGASSGAFSDPNFALIHCSRCNHSPSETSSDPISFSAKCIKSPISRHKALFLGPDDLTFGPLEPDHLGISPALVGLTNRSEGQFRSIIPALLPPLEDLDIRPPPDQPNDLTTPTPKILHNGTSYFGQDALEKLKQNRPVRSGRESTVPTPHQSGARRMVDVAAQDAAVAGRSGNVQGRNNAEIVWSIVADLEPFRSRRTSRLCRFAYTEVPKSLKVPDSPLTHNTTLLGSLQ